MSYFWNDGGGQCPVEYGCDGTPITEGGGSGGGSTTECPIDGYVKNEEEVCVLEESMDIILDESFKNNKAECVYNNLQSLSADFSEAIKKFDGEFPVSHLKFIMDNLGTNLVGQTRPLIDFGSGSISPNYVITIALNNNQMSKAGVNYRPNLMVAKTLAHEVIHAEMFRKLMSLTKDPNFNGFTRQELINLLSSGDFPGI